jgi:hypothetical protein
VFRGQADHKSPLRLDSKSDLGIRATLSSPNYTQDSQNRAQADEVEQTDFQQWKSDHCLSLQSISSIKLHQFLPTRIKIHSVVSAVLEKPFKLAVIYTYT